MDFHELVLAKALSGGGGGSVDAYTKAQTDSLLANKADKSNTVTTSTYANASRYGIVQVALDGYVGCTDNGKLFIKDPTVAEVDAEQKGQAPLTLVRIPRMMSNYGLNKTTISGLNDAIGSIDSRINAIEVNPFVNATVLTAQEAEDFDYSALPTGSFVYILKDYSTPSVQSLSMTPMMSGLALPEDMGEEIEVVEDNTLNPLQTANNLRFANTLTETSLDIEEGDSE